MKKIWAKIKEWYYKVLYKITGKEPPLLIYTAPAQPIYSIWTDTKRQDSLIFTDMNGDDIFRIDQDGNAYWLKEDSYNEAAEMFLTAATWNIENLAGVQQSRMDWEKNITESLIHAAEERGGSISADELTDVIRKCIMYDKLRGKYGTK